MDEELSKAIEDGTVGPKADPKDGVGDEAMGMMGWDMSQKQQKNMFLQVFWFQWENSFRMKIFHFMYDFRSCSFVSFRFSILEWWEVLIHPNVRQFVA